MMYGHGWNGFSGWWGWIGMTLMIVFWIALVALIVYAVSRAFAHPSQSVSGPGAEDRAMRRLRERFARGEITEEEYRQISSTLRDIAH